MCLKKLVLLFYPVALILVFAGCGTTSIQVPITRPAEINLKGIRKIAVGEISGFMGQDLSDELTTALFNSGRYEVLDRQNLNSILSEQGLTWAGISDPSQSAKLGSVIGAAALVVGRISNNRYEEKITYEDSRKKDGSVSRYYWRTGIANLTANLSVVEVQTGRILAIKQFEASYKTQTGAENSYPALIDTLELYRSCRNDVVTNFVRMIAPYTVYAKMSFVSDSKIPELDHGISMAKVGNWEDAKAYFQRAIDQNPESWKTYYDLGVAYECVGDYEKAIGLLTEAYSLNPTGSIQNEITYCKKRIEEGKKLKEQLEK